MKITTLFGWIAQVWTTLSILLSSSKLEVASVCIMAKSLRSKIKRKFRTELRQRIGVPHQEKQEAKIQENLKKAIQAQGTMLIAMNDAAFDVVDLFCCCCCIVVGGSSVLGLKQLMGTTSAPVARIQTENAMDIDESTSTAMSATIDTVESQQDKKKKKAKKPRKKKFVHFHTLRKKGV